MPLNILQRMSSSLSLRKPEVCMRLKHTRIFLSAAFIIAARSIAVAQTDIARIPGFYRNPPSMAGVLIGIGSGADNTEAMTKAMEDIATQLKVDVSLVIDARTKQTTEGGEIAFSEDVDVVSRQKVTAILKDTKRLHSTIADDGTYYVLVYYPTDERYKNEAERERIEGELLDTIMSRYRSNLFVTTLFSSIIPGTGQMMNKHYLKGGILTAAAAGLLLTSALSTIGAMTDLKAADDARRNDNTLYERKYEAQAQEKLILGITAILLYIAESIYSGIDNYSTQR